MPSVGMRRSTRVFGARVLRSGRKLWTKPHEGNKNVQADHVENEWDELLQDSVVDVGATDSCKETKQENKINDLGDVVMEELAPECEDAKVNATDRMHGLVYRRKRKRAQAVEVVPNEDRRYGKKFFRKQWRKRSNVDLFGTYEVDRGSAIGFSKLAMVVNGPSYGSCYWITSFITTVLSYMSKVRIGVRRLSAFLLSRPIYDAYTSSGVLFLKDYSNSKGTGICILSGSKSLIPVFSVNISTIPSFFMHMQTNMCIRSAHFACFLVAHSVDLSQKVGEDTYMDGFSETQYFEAQSYMKKQDSVEVVPHDLSQTNDLSHSATFGIKKSALRTLQSRNSCHIQKRRSSMRLKKRKTPSGFRPRKSFGTLAADFVRTRQGNMKGSPVKSGPTAKNIRDLRCTFTQETFVTGCCAILLIMEPKRCFREEGVTVSLELSSSKQWFLAVNKDGRKKYSLSAKKAIRPSSTSRFSNATIWAIDGGSKLEFPNKRDWLVFKELHKECYKRNMLLSTTSIIPVPDVQEVLEPTDENCKPFVRPDLYIRARGDELSRVLESRSAIYDMDSDDEAWLAELNEKLCGGEEVVELVTPESFELIIDSFEKKSHCSPEENFDDQGLHVSCMHLERREVVEAVHGYWVRKRKLKRAPLVKILQLYQPRRIQVIPKSVLRKKRSFKRQPSQVGRGKHRPNFSAATATATECEILEQQKKNVEKLQEAKASAGRFEALSILMRHKAQMLMANADLATYKAFMALRIAEAAQSIPSFSPPFTGWLES